MKNSDDQTIDPDELKDQRSEECRNANRADLDARTLQVILKIVLTATGHDFGFYKSSTVSRRIERRMAANNLPDPDSYIALLQKDLCEAECLSKDILIGVTSFFRDPEAFETLRREVLPQLFTHRRAEDPVRLWHACCSTGEEVYSMAILIQEYLACQKIEGRAQIFATDIDDVSIARARTGAYYPDSIGQTMDRDRLRTFFAGSDDRFQVTKQLREMIIFACHDLLKDPPFSKLDLIVCRNALIYLNPEMQYRLIALFHQALRPGGFLFLGSSESLGKNSDLFVPIDKKWKIFRRCDNKYPTRSSFPLAPTPHRSFGGSRDLACPISGQPDPGSIAEKLLMDRYSPPCVVVNDRYEVVYFSTRTSRYLEVPVGEPTRDILRLAREELRPALRAAIHKAISEQNSVDFKGIKLSREGAEEAVNVRVESIGTSSSGKLAMVILEPAVILTPLPPFSSGEISSGPTSPQNLLVGQLEDQLRITHEQLQATIEQLATSSTGLMSTNEELVFLNEEYQSANEELQSTNEELETSKEELQSLNEELTTVNTELQVKVEELDQLNSDMENLLASSEVAIVFLDRQLVIRRFSPALAEIFNLIPADIGRPYRHLTGVLDWPCLPQDAETVLKNLLPMEREVKDREGERHYQVRILPYQTPFSKTEGIVVTLTNITERKEAEKRIRSVALFPEENPFPVLRVTADGILLYANRASASLLDQWKCVIGESVPNPVRREIAASLNSRLNRELEIRCGERDLSFQLVPIPDRGYVNFYGRDITEQKQAGKELRASEERFRVIFEQAAVGIAHVCLEGRFLYCNRQLENIVGYSEDRLAERTIQEITHSDDQAADHDLFRQLLAGECSKYSLEKRYLRSNGAPVWVSVSVSLVRNQAGEPEYCIAVIKDIEARKQAEEALARSYHRTDLLAEAARRLLESGSSQSTVETLCHKIMTFLDCQVFINFLVHQQPAHLQLNASAGVPEEKIRDMARMDCRSSICGQVAREGRAIISEDFAATSDTANEMLKDLGIQAFACHPLVVQGQVLGTLAFGTCTRTGFSHEDLSVMKAVADQVAIAMERKQAEEALRGREAQLQTILENLHQGLIVSDLQGNLLHWNRAALTMHEYAGFDEGRRQLDDFAKEFEFLDSAGTILTTDRWPLTRILAGEHLENLELQLRRHKTGWQRMFSYGGTLVRDSDGQSLMAVITVTDITERKRSEEELRLSAERLNRAQEIAHLGSWEVDLATNRLIWSDEVYRIFGLQPQEFEGSYDDFLEAVHPNDRAAVDAAYNNSLINGRNTYEIEHRVVRPGTGEVRIVHERCEHVRDESGRLIRSVGMVHDITERKRNEEDLRLAKEAAEAATRTKSQFLANMSHELRTPMTGVLGMLELTLADDLSPGQRENLLVVKKSADALLRILNDILDFSRIEAGMLTILEEPLHLSGCLRDIAEFFTLEARQKGLQLIQEIDPDIPELILGDEGRIRQVLINLMANAIKFTDRGKLTLQVKAGELDDKGRRLVTFIVADTGIGISLQQQEILFQPFSQADLSHSRRYQGTGLGLAISKEIVQHMEGSISLASEPGKGTSFVVTLPCRVVSPRETVKVETAPVEKPVATRDDRVYKLLVAEDDPVVRQLLSHMLKIGGFDFSFATDGLEAVRMWEEETFDLILMDMQMPEMNGFDACRMIREKEQTKDRRTPIVALTAVYPRKEQRRLEAGMDAWVAKPIDFKKLFSLIKELIP